MTAPEMDTLPTVSVFPAPALRWRVVPPPDPQTAHSLATALNLPPALAGLLIQRGHDTEERARRYLRPALAELSDPHRLMGMAEAVEAIVRTVRAGGRILVHGDYDVDGQCASALLTRVLRLAGADVLPFLPHRLRDGYDFGPAGLEAALVAGASLVITCDCGITAYETVAAARGAGIDVIVTDHHLPGERLPPALAVIDPQRADDTSEANCLCGTGIAFKLAQALVPALAAGLVLFMSGASVNTMILAGFVIALGVVVDDAILDVENIMRRLRLARRAGDTRSTARIILDASLEVRAPIVYATLIVVTAVVPVLFMQAWPGPSSSH